MKSPVSSVGTIESEGILNGSYKKERKMSTTPSTGQKSYAHVIRKFSFSRPFVARCLSTNLSSNHTIKNNSVTGTRIKLKSKSTKPHSQLSCSFFGKIKQCFTSSYLSTFNTAKNASCGISTLPTCFMRFLPSFCFASNFFLRDTSPP